MKRKEIIVMILAGLLIGASALFLMRDGGSGICMACSLRESVEGMNEEANQITLYARPEIIGLILGSFFISLITKEFKSQGGAAPLMRLILGIALMIGSMAFLGCPMRMLLRMGAGDLNAWIAMLGFVAGVFIGTLFLKGGFRLGRPYKQHSAEGALLPFSQGLIMVFMFFAPLFMELSTEDTEFRFTSWLLSLLVALFVGAIAQRSRFCQTGALRNIFLFRDSVLLWGSLGMLAASAIYHLVSGQFTLGFVHVNSHQDHLWNFLGLFVVGLASSFLGACPLRQLILAGTGDSDAALTVVGILMGAILSNKFHFTAAADLVEDGKLIESGGMPENGKIAVLVTIVILLLFGFVFSGKRKREKSGTNIEIKS